MSVRADDSRAEEAPEEPAVDSVAPSGRPDGAHRRRNVASSQLEDMAEGLQQFFERGRRVLSFGEYLELFATHPARYGRDATQYVHDLFAHYGVTKVEHPWGKQTRFRLFDAPWAESDVVEPRLIGHERLQGEIFRAIHNFAREGRANRLLLMHGPNGSAKSTAASCLLRALEEYSKTDDGALYRFHWIFPNRKTSRGTIGFGGAQPAGELESYAHLEDDDIDARLVIELRDHPLFLLPVAERRRLIDRLWKDAGVETRPSRWLYDGELSHKNKQIYEALLADYGGSLKDVLRHVQVERYFISRRYRCGAVTLGPQMSVDAGERQLTADRSLAALPTSLQATTLFEAHGELVEAAGGVLEFSDLLKRPLDAFRYLQLTLETGEVALPQQTVLTNVVMMGSANEIHMSAFREHPEYASFRGRLELMRVPYLLNVDDEQTIYDTQIVPTLRQHVAPHTTRVGAEFAVLTRMRRPDPDRYEGRLAELVEGLTAVEKMELYATGTPPARLSTEDRKLLHASVAVIYQETDSDQEYEGRAGCSPRVVRTLLLDAAQNEEYGCVSPFALLEALDELCKRTGEFEWLELEPLSGHYHDHAFFREEVRRRLMNRVETDMRTASGLVAETQYEDLFRRYINHVSAYVKGEKIRNTITGKDEDPDESLMSEVEDLLGLESEVDAHRDAMISMVAAWALENPEQPPSIELIFPAQIEALRTAAFLRLRKPLAKLMRDMVTVLEGGKGLSQTERAEATQMLEQLKELGYNEVSAMDAVGALLNDRYRDLS